MEAVDPGKEFTWGPVQHRFDQGQPLEEVPRQDAKEIRAAPTAGAL
jgi:hypothetical protein